ncbi:MAG: SDR family NAD(P)-dependent oxidoreductase [Myxococcota bacterium]
MGLLDGRRAVVTGGASGIGCAACRRFSDEGALVAVLDVAGAGARAVADEVGGIAREVDVADAAAVEESLRWAAAELGGLSILFNNAGVGRLAPFEANGPEQVERVLAVNLIGVYNGIRAAAPLMQRTGGSIINNASLSGLRPTRGEAPYSAAKAGVIALSQSAALELGPRIRVNTISPGLIRTPLTEALFTQEALLRPAFEATPLGRTGAAEEVADVAVFLASDLSRFVTGQNLVVDGGLSLPQAGLDGVLRRLLARASGSG